MRTVQNLILVLTLAIGVDASARMITPEDSVHRLMDGEKNSGVKSQTATGLAGQFDTIKNDVVKKVSSIWDRVQKAAGMKQEQVVQKPARVPASVPSNDESLLAEKLTELPEINQKNEQQLLKSQLEQTRADLTAKNAIEILDAGRPGTSKLPNTKAGVPYTPKAEMLKIVNVPRLDIGLEKSIKKSDFLTTDLANILKTPGKATALKTPETLDQKTLLSWVNKKIELSKEWTGANDGEYGLGKIVTFEKVEKVDVEMKPEQVMEALKAIHPINEDDLKMIAGLLLYKKGDKCHVASGLFHELSSSESYKDEANFYLGVCSHKMGFHSEAVTRLSRVVRAEDPDYGSEAIDNLVEDLPAEYEVEVAKLLRNLKNKSLISEKSKDSSNYILARGANESQDRAETVRYADLVRPQSPLYMKAQYLKGIAQYGLGQGRQAEKTLEDLRTLMAKGKDDKNLRALISVNLGRIKFQMGRFEASFEDYMKVPKDHPLWVDALIEQGWTQLNKGDAAGAIGNMYSLHSPYFRSVYMPESWVVRTIGYIDICQYGDAYKTLTKLDKMHGEFLTEVKNYLQAKSNPNLAYQTVRTYLKGQSDRPVDGLSAQVIRETARQRDFLNVQDSINRAEDELAQYDFIRTLIDKDIRQLKSRKAKAIERREQAKIDLAKIAAKPELAKNEAEWKASLRSETVLVQTLGYEIEVHDLAGKGFGKMKQVAEARIDKEKSDLRTNAGKALLAHLKNMTKDLENIIEGNEFLRYEIFSGSGEDIRYQAAGGRTVASQKIPSNVKPQKILNWDFDGEYWEDEIGSYRSTLRNNCPNRTASITGAGEK